MLLIAPNPSVAIPCSLETLNAGNEWISADCPSVILSSKTSSFRALCLLAPTAGSLKVASELLFLFIACVVMNDNFP
jgi:hypothetical protein